ncbi:zinc transport system substrate-binding protein [Rubricella aquisinus]|uniref:High-affinity zinc uptake system protein ZnuA n=1 Tax=Rubricella aquisinus TaxID=2028108 RepID=A0A840X3T2_9RHOB|nr:zinc ABC transporter substrate-binding protein [Rubricella aquisinus]MBB5516466.1 zinc transport system substrate-binding protein [Rubricella aquisinus]
MSRNRAALTVACFVMATPAVADVPNVAVDIAPVHSLVARVMDGVGTPSLILPPGATPHEYSLRPSEASALQSADIVVWMGEGLTPWLDGAIDTLASGASVLSLLAAEETTLLAFREGALFEGHDHDHGHDDHGHDDHGHDDHAHDDHGHDDHKHDDHGHDHDKHDHGHDEHAHDNRGHDDHAHDDHAHDNHGHDDHGHAHEGADPHAWLSPSNAKVWLDLIAAKLSAADPENAGSYAANAAAGRAELDALAAEVNGILAPVRGGSFVVFHDAYQYFEADFDIPASGAISLSDATDPSPARVAEIKARVQDDAIACVLAEPQFNIGLVATVLDGTDAATGVIDPLGVALEPGPALYPDLIRNMAKTLAECL